MTEENATILIVDDEADIRDLIREVLQSEGYHCLEAANATAALSLLERETIDVVMLDIVMAGKSGLEMLSELKMLHPNVAVVMATGISDMDTAIECTRRGAIGYLTKPFKLSEVVRTVQQAADQARLERRPRDYHDQLERRVEEQARTIRKSFLASMAALSFALEAKDSYTAGHSRRVTDIANAIGLKMGLSEDELEDLHWGSLLHDIGKIAVRQDILNKPTTLTTEEYEHVMTHTVIGTSIVEPIVNNRRITDIVECHHYHYDGQGLKQRLKGKQIPRLARIVTVADAYDAMTSQRAFRPALSRKEALNEIRLAKGTQFDPVIADLFLTMSDSEVTPQKREILIADDEESIRLLVRSALGDHFTMIEASDGLEALKVAHTRKPALILMDILMPKKDGLAACHDIKSNVDTKDIPIVMLTGIAHDLDKELSTHLGADAYITKPFTPDYLHETVESTLAEHDSLTCKA